ncbi:phosphodiester glycosidase family protein [Paenibacillus fonticola]|uniref:phosphodiester glycosidase family protein n=1 Tax=Paenibacillus fonticola TaxID=379896 RepID=UPI0003A448A3|nr:phosphodiester glycosidase family protein [Paenibacillus fonticola]
MNKKRIWMRWVSIGIAGVLLGGLFVNGQTAVNAQEGARTSNAQVSAQPTAKPGIKQETKKVKVGNKSFTVQTVRIPKGTPVTVGLAKNQVGSTEAFASIVKNYRAEAAINGAFFEAYGGPPDPYGMLIANGELIHKGGYGTTIGFKKDGTAIMDSLRATLTGTVVSPEGKSMGWYATFLNRVPVEGSSTSILFNPARGSKVGFTGGIAVTVDDGKVVKNEVNANAAIPDNGFVLVFTGTQKSTAERFAIGSEVNLQLTYKDAQDQPLPEWEDIVTGVGAGPRLVKDSKVALNAAEEGFNDSKILTASAARSGLAIMQDGSIMLATVPGATMKQWADIMKALGAKQAMNLDGGASSAMYSGGKIVTPAGRLLSNTLVFGSSLNK